MSFIHRDAKADIYLVYPLQQPCKIWVLLVLWQWCLEATEPPALSQATSLAPRELQLYTWSCVPAVFKINVQIIFIIQHPQTAVARWPGSWVYATSKEALYRVVFHKELELPVVTWSVSHLILGVAADLAWTPLGSIKQMKYSTELGEPGPRNHGATQTADRQAWSLMLLDSENTSGESDKARTEDRQGV